MPISPKEKDVLSWIHICENMQKLSPGQWSSTRVPRDVCHCLEIILASSGCCLYLQCTFYNVQFYSSTMHNSTMCNSTILQCTRLSPWHRTIWSEMPLGLTLRNSGPEEMNITQETGEWWLPVGQGNWETRIHGGVRWFFSIVCCFEPFCRMS